MGPTASGKTKLAIQLYKHIPCEIINVDSTQVYTGMDIGTAKPTKQELLEAPHQLIDIRKPDECYSVADFRHDALSKIKCAVQNQKIPLLVGGTMLYFKLLKEGISDLPTANQEIRKNILKEASVFGWKKLHEKLQLVDPKIAKQIKNQDTQRIQRALEVYEITKKPLSMWQEQKKLSALKYPTVNFAIYPKDRKILHERIATRFKKMINDGLIEEVQKLYHYYADKHNMPFMKAVGYRQVLAYLEGKYDYDEMVNRGVISCRQLAKRQLTWLRNWQDIHWIDSLSSSKIQDVMRVLNKMHLI